MSTIVTNLEIMYKEFFNDTELIDTHISIIGQFLLNVILVINKCRIAYRVDIQKSKNYLIKKICSIEKNLTINDIDSPEPYLYLKDNEQYVKNNISSSKDIGNLLEYIYSGPNWYNIEIDRYLVSIRLTSLEDNIFLYSCMCPMEEFDI